MKGVHPKIFIAEDDEDILRVASLMFEDLGCSIESFKNGREFFERILSDKPDIVIMDVFFGDSDGREICRDLRDHSQTQNIPIIMLAGTTEVRRSALQAGADEFLDKPFDRIYLLRIVKTYLKSIA